MVAEGAVVQLQAQHAVQLAWARHEVEVAQPDPWDFLRLC
jgi:hypothetical protein